MGFTVLRFNFPRHSGASQGEYDQGYWRAVGCGLGVDYLPVEWTTLQTICWVGRILVRGLGSGMQLLICARPEITGFISVAPPANMYDFSFLGAVSCIRSGDQLHSDSRRTRLQTHQSGRQTASY